MKEEKENGEIQITYEKDKQVRDGWIREEIVKGEERVRADRKGGRKQQDEHEEVVKVQFYNDHKSGWELIQNIIDVIRHQQFILDNMDHLVSYNEVLLKVWKRQMNLLDRYDRFQYYKQLWVLKEVLRRMKESNGILEFVLKGSNMDNEELLSGISRLLEQLRRDLKKGEEREENKKELKLEIDYLKCRSQIFLRCPNYL